MNSFIVYKNSSVINEMSVSTFCRYFDIFSFRKQLHKQNHHYENNHDKHKHDPNPTVTRARNTFGQAFIYASQVILIFFRQRIHIAQQLENFLFKNR